MSEKLKQRILEHVTDRTYRPKKAGALARDLGIERREFGAFRDAIRSLQRAGRIVLGEQDAVLAPEVGRFVIGKYRANPRGFGFIIPDSPQTHGDLFVPEGQGADAITGDTVRARVFQRGKRQGKTLYRARVEDVLERGHSRFVGELHEQAGAPSRPAVGWYVRPDGNALHVPIAVPDAAATGAKAGDKVVVEMLSYPGPDSQAAGVIVEVLGRRGEPGVDELSIIREYQLPDQFGQEVLNETRRVVRGFRLGRAAGGRRDLRRQTVVTIDPPDARDFDDAISVRVLSHGGFELGVHIADVTEFVTPDSALDREARSRGNSVYFPGRVLPMLPELLSNGLCSLQEGQDRLTRSAFIRYDTAGKVVATEFANTLINSSRRLTYEQASLILDGKTGGFSRAVVTLVRRMDELARVIERRRRRDGALRLDIPELELVLDGEGRVKDARPADDSYSHTIIEMFMVEANEAVAGLLSGLGVPSLRRTHPDPDAEALANLSRYLQLLGLDVPRAATRHDLQRVVDKVRGTPAAFAVNMAILRSMQQAVYSPEPIGHYALASDHYSHFTSPIRRYPDLTVHRLLDAYIRGELRPVRRPKRPRESHDQRELVALGRHCSYTERRAADAERDLKTVKVLELLATRLGQECHGVVTGVTQFGVFVQIEGLPVDGLIGLEDLPEDWWHLDPRSGRLIGQYSGQRIAIGDVLVVRIAAVDPSKRRLDLGFVSRKARPDVAAAGPTPRKPSAPRKRKASHRKGARHSKRRTR